MNIDLCSGTDSATSHARATIAAMPFRLLAAMALAGLLSVACGITTPADNTIDDIAGVIPVGGSDFREFSVKNNGELQVTITSLVPSPSASIGAAVGQVVSGQCVPIQNYLSPLVANRTIEFGYINKGSFCALFYDTGALRAQTNYTGKISHP